MIQKTGLWVKPIKGAPGDGDFALTRAIGYALADAGVIIIKKRTDAEFELKAQVRINSPKLGKQHVVIDWIVSGNEDQEIGRATQKNTVPVGTFKGRWGQMAMTIAAAAANSVIDIVNHERNRRFNSGSQVTLPMMMSNKKGEKIKLPSPTLIPK